LKKKQNQQAAKSKSFIMQIKSFPAKSKTFEIQIKSSAAQS
jgi:hypothetical protein